MNMMTTIPTSAAATMSSLEIAELTGKEHFNVLIDIRAMLAALGLGLEFQGYYVASNGKRNPLFNLPKRECLILVSGYSVTLRAAIVDRWAELEAAYARLDATFNGSKRDREFTSRHRLIRVCRCPPGPGLNARAVPRVVSRSGAREKHARAHG